MSVRKFGIATLAGVLAVAAGMLLSGYFTLLLLRLDTRQFGWNTYYRYVAVIDHPQLAPFAARIRWAGYAGFGLPLLVVACGGVHWAWRHRQRSLHGDARFASRRELARHGLFAAAGTGIVVGRSGGKLLRLDGQQFVILAAPTRSGKGVGLVIPNLLDYTHSVVVLDIKQENFALTSGWRASQGHQVFLFNPFAEDGRTHRWNPFGYVADDPAMRVSDLMGIAAMLYPDGAPEQKFWIGQARNAFMALALYLFENRDDARASGFAGGQRMPTLGSLHRLSAGDGGNLKHYLQDLAGRPFLSGTARTAFAGLLSQADETFASIMGTLREPLNAWVNPTLDRATAANDFLLTDLRRRRITLYIGIQPGKLAESRLILNLLFSQLINLNTRQLPSADPQLKYQCLLLMDEFTAIGKIDIIASAASYMAGYNLRLLPVIQSMAQLDATYGKEVARTLLTNHALQVLYAPREQRDANDYSEMLGYTSVRRKHVTHGRERSHHYSEERRALMLPQELKAMGSEREVFLYEGIAHPVSCDKIRYYKDRHFTARLLPPVPVPLLGGEPAARPAAVGAQATELPGAVDMQRRAWA